MHVFAIFFQAVKRALFLFIYLKLHGSVPMFGLNLPERDTYRLVRESGAHGLRVFTCCGIWYSKFTRDIVVVKA